MINELRPNGRKFPHLRYTKIEMLAGSFSAINTLSKMAWTVMLWSVNGAFYSCISFREYFV